MSSFYESFTCTKRGKKDMSHREDQHITHNHNITQHITNYLNLNNNNNRYDTPAPNKIIPIPRREDEGSLLNISSNCIRSLLYGSDHNRIIPPLRWSCPSTINCDTKVVIVIIFCTTQTASSTHHWWCRWDESFS